MTYIIPNQESKKHLQDNKSDITGTIYQSRNINLDEDGYIKLSEGTFAQFTTDNSADFSTADAMFPSATDIYINSDEVFSGDAGVTSLTNRSTDTGSPSPGVEEDVIYFNGTEVVSDGSSIYYRSALTTWTAVSVSGSGFSTASPTCLCVYEKENSLAVGNNNVVKFINTSWAVNGTILTLPNQYRVSSMSSIGNTLYIATRNDAGTESMLFVVDSIQTGADNAYPTGAWELMSINRLKSTIVGINSLGELVRFNGGGFDVLATLPIYKTNIEWGDAQNDYSTVSNRALTIDGDLVYVNLSSLTQDGTYVMLPSFPSGIWCYDSSNGSFYHRYSPSYTRIQTISGSDATVNTTNNTFTLTSGNLNNVVTGMPVLFDDGSGTKIPELYESSTYFIIKDSSTVFKLASSYTNAIAGTPIDITGTGNTGQNWYIFLTNDYGWSFYGTRMSMAIMNTNLMDKSTVGRVCMTAELFSKQDNETDKTVFCPISRHIPNRGYFITPRLNSTNITDTYNTCFLKYKPLGEDDKIVIKYKTKVRKNFPKSSVERTITSNWFATWTDTDTFTTIADMSDLEVGDEIEIIAGVGSGHIAHVSSVSESSGTYTINLSESFPFAVANDIFYFIADNWTYLDTITSSNQTGEGFYKSSIIDNKNSKFIQFKVELRGIGVTIEEMQVFNSEHIGA